MELPVPATTLWAATLQQPPISGRNLHATLYPALPTQHPAHPSAQPARAGVRSESLNPAERTNKKTAGSHGTGGLDDRPHLLRRQVRYPAPLPHRPSTSPREHSRLHLHARTANPNNLSPPFSTTSLTPLKQLTAARTLLARHEHPGARCCPSAPQLSYAPEHAPRPDFPVRPALACVPARAAPALCRLPVCAFLRPSPATAFASASGAPLPPSFSPPPPAFSSISAHQHACNGRWPHHRALRRCHHRQPLELQLQHSIA